MQTVHTTFSFPGGFWDSSVQAGCQRRHKVYAWREYGHLLWNALVLIFQKNKPDFLEQYALRNSGFFYLQAGGEIRFPQKKAHPMNDFRFKFKKEHPEEAKQSMEGKGRLILRGCGGAMRSRKLAIWRLQSHSNSGAAGFRTTNPIVRRKKLKAGFLKIP